MYTCFAVHCPCCVNRVRIGARGGGQVKDGGRKQGDYEDWVTYNFQDLLSCEFHHNGHVAFEFGRRALGRVLLFP